MDHVLLKFFIPELFLISSTLIHLLYNISIVQYKKINYPILNKELLFQCSFIIVGYFLLINQIKIEGNFYNFMFIVNSGTITLKLLIITFLLILIVPCWRHFLISKLNFFEYFTLVLLLLFTLTTIVCVNDLLLIYILLEMQSILFYILVNFNRLSAFATEAGLKYFISGSFFSGIFLIGLFIIYCIFGTLNLSLLELLLSTPLNNTLLKVFISVGFLMITITFFFKLSAAPFHFWSPDVYEGSPLCSTVILSTVPKLVIITLFIKWLYVTFFLYSTFMLLFFIVGFLSILFGIFFANRQKRIKRFIAYSSITQIGYALLFLIVLNNDAITGIYFFFIIYLITSIALWLFITFFDIFNINTSSFNFKERTSLYFSNLSNFVINNKYWTICLLIIFSSLAGLPPFSGFLAKLFVFITLTELNKWFLNLFLVILTCLVIWYYINIISIIFIEIHSKELLNVVKFYNILHSKLVYDFLDFVISSVSIFFLVLVFFYPSFLFIYCQYISLMVF